MSDDRKIVLVKAITGYGYTQFVLRPAADGRIYMSVKTDTGCLIALSSLSTEEALALQAAINDCLLQMEENNE